MESIEWWEQLDPDTRDWLIAHNGEALPAHIVTAISEAGGDFASGAWWVGETDEGGVALSDEAIDWIEAVANDEAP
jgi:hypothetical protein